MVVLTSVQDWLSNTTSFGYDVNSNLTTETLPSASGVVDTFSFDAADRLTGISDKQGKTTLFTATYTRDNANQLTSDSSIPSSTNSYNYNTLNQLCYAGSSTRSACSSPPRGAIAYAYDAADNLTQKGSAQQAFNNADELCWTASSSGPCASPPTGATTYTYDTRGNRTKVTPSSGGATTLTYDQANRLITYGTSATYAYNGDGLRMSKTISGTTSQFLWDVAPALPLLLKDGSTGYVYGPGGLPLEQINGSTAFWLHQDQLGSTRLVTDGTGASQATYTFDAYGNLTASTGTISNPMQFAGEYRDAESSSYYLRARYYDPSTGQFISRDADLVITGRPYSYVSNDPLNYRDPYGLDGRVGENGEPVNAWDIIKQFRPLTPEEEQNYRQYLRTLGLEPQEVGPKLPGEKIEMERLRAEESSRLRENGTDPAQDTLCTTQELKSHGLDPHELKDYQRGVNIFKDSEGNLYLKPTGGIGPGDPLGIKIR